MTTSSPAAVAHAAASLGGRAFGLIVMQLAILTVLVHQFHLEESRHLFAAMALGTGGFVLHALLPVRFRPAVFLGLSIAAAVLVLGVTEAAKLLALVAAITGIVSCPVSWPVRVGLCLAAGAALVWFRSDSDDMFWPILGSMFMFRLLIHLQTERSRREPTSLVDTASYFLMWPNVFFPLFPVIDARTFRDTYYNAERRAIYQTGVHWIAVGVGHLVLYRFIKYELLPSPLEIRTPSSVALFLSMNYALYVRVSGHFHIICGLLHLFGYNLPRTHDLYFLASSFSDVWRRINIYWKDFMMKTFFFPAFFQARRWGNLVGVAVAVLWVFLWTWLAHSWQVFWLIDVFPLRTTEAALWLGVGGLVAINAMLDYRQAAKSSKPMPLTILTALVRAVQTVFVFTCVSLFWAEWGNPDVLKMLVYSLSRMPITTADIVSLGLTLGTVLVGVTLWQFGERFLKTSATFSFDNSVRWHLLALSAGLVITQPPVYELFGSSAAKQIADLQTERASRGEALAIIDGYYEELNDKSLQSGPFLKDPAPKRTGPAVDFGDMSQYRNDLLEHELIPNWKGSWSGAPITINRWGMRDRDRTITKPAETYRIALVGSSVVMGFGVGDDETFAHLLEERLNADGSGRRYEVLNFGVGRYGPVHRRLQIEHKVLPFQPDLVVYLAHQDEMYTAAKRIAPAVSHGIELEDPCLDDIVQQAGITKDTSAAMIQVKLEAFPLDILRCVNRRIVETVRDAGADLLYVYLPVPGEHDLPFDPKLCLSFAQETGFDTADLSKWEGDRPPLDVLLRAGEHHPNALGHRLIADQLEPILRERLRTLSE